MAENLALMSEKMYPHFSFCFAGVAVHHVEEFCEVISTRPKLLSLIR